jgi:hypothetical protein
MRLSGIDHLDHPCVARGTVNPITGVEGRADLRITDINLL